ncbi:MAG: helix-turn-helix transcriptional regulator [Desulfomonile tiedjei]|nr:helix-turn-helix transcriptional regulator [Desulfomonile tiedjei]
MRELASTMLVTPANAEDFLTQFGALFGPMERDVHEVSLAAEGPLLSGRLEVHPIRPGMRLFSMKMDVRQDVELDIEPGNPGVLFSLVLDGSSGYAVHRPAGRHDDPWDFLPGRNIVGTFQPEKSRWRVSGGDSHRLVELHIASGRALQLFAEYLKSAAGPLHPILGQTNGFPRHIQQALTPELTIVAHQVLNCPLQGPARGLFMESKALEILALQLESVSSSSLRETAVRNKEERNRLEEARRILDREFADPPSLLTLARRVGLNDFKLKSGFRDLYRTTVFGYVRMLKMETARAMLQAGDLNVSEVAAATGYTCFGHFAAAFRKRFGVAPREFKKVRRS